MVESRAKNIIERSGGAMSGMPRFNEPSFNDVERGVRDASKYTPKQLERALQRSKAKERARHPHTQTKVEAAAELGETSDEYGMKFERDLRVDMPEGQEIAARNPDVQTESPESNEVVEGGFNDATEDRPPVEE
jgi:hypothetical protein